MTDTTLAHDTAHIAEPVRTLIVVAHPDPDSLTHHIARQLESALALTRVEVADLASEGFDPRFTLTDRHSYHAGGDFHPSIAAEHARIDQTTDMVLVFPLYWWSLPALLKGWIDRVFVNGWAFIEDVESGLIPKLGHLRVHLLPIAGTGPGIRERHGYADAFGAQIEHGIIDFCGSRRGATVYIDESESTDTDARRQAITNAVEQIRNAIIG